MLKCPRTLAPESKQLQQLSWHGETRTRTGDTTIFREGQKGCVCREKICNRRFWRRGSGRKLPAGSAGYGRVLDSVRESEEVVP